MSDCTTGLISNMVESVTKNILDNCLDRKSFIDTLSKMQITKEEVIKKMLLRAKRNEIFKREFDAKIKTSIETYVTDVFSELGQINPNSENQTFVQIEGVPEKVLKSDTKRLNALPLSPYRLSQFKIWATKVINSSLYTVEESEINPITGKQEKVKYFINTQEDVSKSLKKLQVQLAFKLLKGHTFNRNTPPEEIITALHTKYRNDTSGVDYFDYLFLANFDSIISDLADITVHNTSNFYSPEYKYSFQNKLAIIKNFGDNDSKTPENIGIKQFIETLKTDNGASINKISFSRAFEQIKKGLINPHSPYQGALVYKELTKKNINDALGINADKQFEEVVNTVYKEVFDLDNVDSLLNIHIRTQAKYPGRTFNLYTMLCNSMNNSVAASYTTVVKNAETGNYENVLLKNNTVNKHKTEIENNIINSNNKEATRKFLENYVDNNYLLNWKEKASLTLKFPNGVKLNIVYTDKKVNIYEIINGNYKAVDNARALDIISNNNSFMKEVLLFDLSTNTNAFNSVTTNGGALEILQFAGAVVLSKQFSQIIEDNKTNYSSFKSVFTYAQNLFNDLKKENAFLQTTNIFKPGIISLSGLEKLAIYRSIEAGDGTLSYVVNSEKHNLPVLKNLSLIGTLPLWFDTLKRNEEDISGNIIYKKPFKDNIFHDMPFTTSAMTSVDTWDPKTKETITKPITKLSSNELFYNNFVYNYLTSKPIGIQPIVYSEKPNINNIWINRDTFKNKDIKNLLFDKTKDIATSLAENVLTNINIFLGTTSKHTDLYADVITAFKQLSNNYLTDENGKGSDKVSDRISEVLLEHPNFEFIEEIHYSLDRAGNVVINPTLLHFFEMYLSHDGKRAFNEYVNIQTSLLAYDLKKNNFSLRDTYNDGKFVFKKAIGSGSQLQDKLNIKDEEGEHSWYNKNTKEYILYKEPKEGNELTVDNILNKGTFATLHPELEKFALIDMLVSSHFNMATIGSAFTHNAKLKDVSTSNALLKEFQGSNVKYSRIMGYESLQTISMYKRAVGHTANLATLAKGLPMGIPDKLRIAVVEDSEEMVLNAQNTSDKVVVHDGAIFITPFTSDMMAASAGELVVNKKHVKPFILTPHENFAVTTEIKSAAFTINNYSIRESMTSPEQYGTMFKKMTNIAFPKDFVLKLNPKDITEVSKLVKFSDGISRIQTITAIEVNKENPRAFNINYAITENVLGVDTYTYTSETGVEINSVYDLWNLLGGAYSYKNGNFNEDSMDRVYKLFATNPELKDYMIHIVAKVSATKTGITNRNKLATLYTDNTTPLNSYTTSAEYVGIQSDNSHEIEEEEVTGSVQQISSLIQGGFTAKEAQEVYKAIESLVYSGMEDLNLVNSEYITPQETLELKQKLSAYVMANIATKSDSAGLSNVIVKYANSENGGGMPFTDPNIINLFTSTVNSVVSKNVIKRTSSGIPAVQAPTINLVSIFETPEGNIFTNSELYKNNVVIDNTEKISFKQLSTIKPGDIISINGGEPIKVAGYNNRIKFGVKSDYPIIGLEDVRRLQEQIIDEEGNHIGNNEITKINSLGRNLRGQNQNITLEDGSIVDLLDLDISVLSYYIDDIKKINGKYAFSSDPIVNDNLLAIYQYANNSLREESASLPILLGKQIDIYTNKSASSYDKEQARHHINELFKRVLQKELKFIKEGAFRLPLSRKGGGVYSKIIKTEVLQAEIILGNAYAKKFGLTQNDFLGEVINQGKSFFTEKLNTAYNQDTAGYDFTLMSLSTPKIFVKVVSELPKNHIDAFKTATKDNRKKYYINAKGDAICPSDNKSMQIDVVDEKIVLSILEDKINLLNDKEIFSYIGVEKLTEDAIKANKINTFLVNNSIISSYVTGTGQFDLKAYSNDKNDFINAQATRLHTSFKQGLEYVGTRIPAQSMQSFMNLKVVAFTPEDTNIVYIPADIILYQGSDFDIDKLYLMGANINSQGIYASWSPFFNYSSTEMLKLSHNLPIPNKLTVNTSEIEGVNIAGIIANLPKDTNYKELRNNIHENKELLNAFINILNLVGDNTVILNMANDQKINDIAELINEHNNYELSLEQRLNSMENKVYGFSLIIGDSLENNISQTTQMSSEIAKTIAQNKKADKEHFSNNNFLSRFNAQERTQKGKGSVGINANGNKAYAALCMYFQSKYSKATTESDLMALNLNIAEYPTKVDPLLSFTIPTIFNANLEGVIDTNLKNYIAKNKWAEEVIEKNGAPVDGFKLLSVLIMASTDNAKDPILEGINCIPQLNGLYITLIALGVDFYTIGAIFTGDFMLELSKHVNSDFTKEETLNNSLTTAIKYMFSGPSISNYTDQKLKFNKETGQFVSDVQNTSEEEEIDMDLMNELQSQEEEAAGEFGRTVKYDKTWQKRYLTDLAYYEKNIKTKFASIVDNEENITTINKVKRNVTELKLVALNNAAKELQTLVSLLSIDGGVKNNQQNLFEHIFTIEEFIKNKIKDERFPSRSFSLEKFLNDKTYAEENIGYYWENKSLFNILDIINTIPHVKAMLSAMVNAKRVVETHTVKGGLSKKFLTDMKFKLNPSKRLPTYATSTIYKFIDQITVLKFLREAAPAVTIKKVQNAYDLDYSFLTTNNDELTLDFSNYSDVMTYKNWFENTLVPYLKGLYKYKSNELIKNLAMTSIFNSTKTDRISLSTPNINLSLVKDQGNINEYSKYLEGFEEIRDTSLDIFTGTLGDAFVLYNIIANQNRPGQYSFNEFFNSYFSNTEELNNEMLEIGEPKKLNILSKFLSFESTITPNDFVENVDYNIDDLVVRFLKTDLKPLNEYTKYWDKENNRTVIKKHNMVLKHMTADDSLDLGNFVKNIKYYKDEAYDVLYQQIADGIKSGKIIIEFRCD